MTMFLYKHGGSYDVPAHKLDFKPVIPCTDSNDKRYSVLFERAAAHMIDRCTVVYVEQGTPRDQELKNRITRALREKYHGPKKLMDPFQAPTGAA